MASAALGILYQLASKEGGLGCGKARFLASRSAGRWSSRRETGRWLRPLRMKSAGPGYSQGRRTPQHLVRTLQSFVH